jgi:hypothetical protein
MKIKDHAAFEKAKHALAPKHRAQVEKTQKAFEKSGDPRAIIEQSIANGHEMLVDQKNRLDHATTPQQVEKCMDDFVAEWEAAVKFMRDPATEITE